MRNHHPLRLFTGGFMLIGAACMPLQAHRGNLTYIPENQGTFAPQAAELAKVPDLAWDGWIADNRNWGLGWQGHGTWIGASGSPEHWPKDWTLAQGFRMNPMTFAGLTLIHEPGQAWKKGLALGADAQVSWGSRLRLSLASPPRPWSQTYLDHRWGFAIRPLGGHGDLAHSWVGVEWPWRDDEAELPALLASWHLPRNIFFNVHYALRDQAVRGSLAIAVKPKVWLASSWNEKGSPTWRAQWRKSPVSDPLLRESITVCIYLNQPWQEGETNRGIFGKVKALGFADLLENLHDLRRDAQVKRVVLVIRGMRADLAMAQEAGRVLDQIRASGKSVDVYMDHVTPLALLLGSHADRIAVHPQGHFGVMGFSSDLAFYRGLLRKIGIEPQFLRHGQYKSFAEPWMREEPSPEFKRNTEEWLGDLWKAYVREIALGRKLDTAQIMHFISSGELSLDSARKYGLIDTLITESGWLRSEAGKGFRKVTLPLPRPYAAPFAAPRKIAVLTLSGPIVDPGSDFFPMLTDPGFSPAQVLPILERIKQSPEIEALVLRLDSPGGSAQASDIIAQALDALRQSGKPVVVSVGGMAASGGYYLATAADRIVAEPTSLLGSIGVVWGKISAEALYAKLGIGHATVKTAPHADAGSLTRPWTEKEQAIIQRHVDGFYRIFSKRVQNGRRLDSARVDSIAQGRVFTGIRGHANGLVDTLGGLETSLTLAGRLAGMPRLENVEAFHFHVRENNWSQGWLDAKAKTVADPKIARWVEFLGESAGQKPRSGLWALYPDYFASPDR